MFLNFKISNYRSIGDEIAVDFNIKDSQRLGSYAEVNDQVINNIACLVGPNASGKSNILSGIVYFLRWTQFSYSRPSRYTGGFTSHFSRNSSPTEFSIEFIDNKKQYKYEVSILDDIVQKEILEKRDENTKRYSYIFSREAGNNISFGKTIKVNKQDTNRLGGEMSLLSLMLELNYFDKNDFLTLNNFHTNINRVFLSLNNSFKINSISQRLQNNIILLDELIEELKNIDTGISSIELKENKKVFKDPDSGEIIRRNLFTILTKHKIDNDEYLLSLQEESSGTMHYIETFINLSTVLQTGGLFIIDELEQSLHPDLTNRIINSFMNKDKNPNNAQLLFTTHNPWFLQELTKTQIFIIEKNDTAQTEITRLDEIAGVRNDENYFVKYLAGEYDGRPKIREA